MSVYLCPSKSPSITLHKSMRHKFVSLGRKSLNKPSKEICFDDLGIVRKKLTSVWIIKDLLRQI